MNLCDVEASLAHIVGSRPDSAHSETEIKPTTKNEQKRQIWSGERKVQLSTPV